MQVDEVLKQLNHVNDLVNNYGINNNRNNNNRTTIITKLKSNIDSLNTSVPVTLSSLYEFDIITYEEKMNIPKTLERLTKTISMLENVNDSQTILMIGIQRDVRILIDFFNEKRPASGGRRKRTHRHRKHKRTHRNRRRTHRK